MSELKRTPLYDAHVSAGATMVDFGGWEMPIQYPAGIITEHLYDRRHCGIFDVSHMGRLIVEGPERVAFLQKVLSSNVSALKPGRAQYCMIPTETGGAVDDAYLYMFEEDRYFLIVNASNTDKDLQHFAKYLPEFDCTITNVTDTISSIAVQGPEAERILKTLSGGAEITGPRKNDLGEVSMEGHLVRASRTGYTGDPTGWELFIDAKDVTWLWNRLIELGAAGAATFTDSLSTELIADGYHVNPEFVRILFRFKALDKVIFISDNVPASGRPEGKYELGGQEVTLKGGLARLADGTIAGSASNLYECMRNAVAFGISKEEAILSATANPAKQIGRSDEIGAIAKGLLADFVVCEEDLAPVAVYMGGEKL